MATLLYPPETSHEQEKYLLSNIKDWSILNGLAVRPSRHSISADIDPSEAYAITAPVTLFPSLFPKICFDEARAIQKAYNELYAAIARDREWLKQIVEGYVQASLPRFSWKGMETLPFPGFGAQSYG